MAEGKFVPAGTRTGRFRSSEPNYANLPPHLLTEKRRPDTKEYHMGHRGTFLIDLDGTIFKHGTDELLPGAREFLDMLKELQYGVVFITRRGDEEWGPNDPRYSEAVTRAALKKHGLDDYFLILNARSPRILVDDSPIDTIPRVTDEGFDAHLLENLRAALAPKDLD